MVDERVRKKLMSVLGSWHRQYKDEARMAIVAGLYQACGGGSQKKVSLCVFSAVARSAEQNPTLT